MTSTPTLSGPVVIHVAAPEWRIQHSAFAIVRRSILDANGLWYRNVCLGYGTTIGAAIDEAIARPAVWPPDVDAALYCTAEVEEEETTNAAD